MFEREGISRMRQLRRIADAMKDDTGHAWSANFSNTDIGQVTVSSVLRNFHCDLARTIEDCSPELLDELVNSLNLLGKNDYREPSFVADRKSVVNLFGHHRHQVHGRVFSQTRPTDVFLVDMSHAVSIYAFFRGSGLMNPTSFFVSNPSFLDGLPDELPGRGIEKIAVHLCDPISFALAQAHGVANALSAAAPDPDKFISFPFDLDDRSTLEIKISVRGFRGYRSLRKTHPEVPVVGANAKLKQAAIRHSHAWTLVSKYFPKNLWNGVGTHSQNVIVEVAEVLVTSWIPALNPSTPSREEMDHLNQMGGIAELDCPIDGLIEHRKPTLDKLGIYEAVRDRHVGENYLDRLDNYEWAWDWTWAFSELREALFDEDVRRSGWVAEQFRIEALHKHLLSFLEAEVIHALRASMAAGDWEPPSGRSYQASGLWKDAFKTQETSNCPYGSWPDREASHAVDATWLSLAGKELDSVSLSELMDASLQSFAEMEASTGIRLTFNPATPADHFISLQQISRDADCSRSMTLCLGRLSIGLRNFLEHGVGEVCDDGLLVKNDEFWETTRGYTHPADKKARQVKLPLHQCVKKVATDSSYPDAADLPDELPISATRLLLTHDSLLRALVMNSLLFQGAKSHLR